MNPNSDRLTNGLRFLQTLFNEHQMQPITVIKKSAYYLLPKFNSTRLNKTLRRRQNEMKQYRY